MEDNLRRHWALCGSYLVIRVFKQTDRAVRIVGALLNVKRICLSTVEISIEPRGLITIVEL